MPDYYISERQNYLKKFFNTNNPSSNPTSEELVNSLNRDTMIKDLISKYSVLFKAENVTAIDPEEIAYMTRRGDKFLIHLESHIGSYDHGKLRILVVTEYQGCRISSDYNEHFEILVFDSNGLLAANLSHGQSYSEVIDGVLYIGFVHERYDANAQASDTKYTSSYNFSVVGIDMDYKNSQKGISPICSSHSSYLTDSSTVISKTDTFPQYFSVGYYANTRTSIENNLVARWMSDAEASDFRLYAAFNLADYLEDLRYLLNNWNTEASGSSILESDYGISVKNASTGTYVDLAVTKQVLEYEIIPDVESRLSFVNTMEIPLSSNLYTTIVSPHVGVTFSADEDTNISAMGMYIIKDKTCNTTNIDAKYSFKLAKMFPGSRIFVQHRSMPFKANLSITASNAGKYSITNDKYSNYQSILETMGLFHEDHGLFAIPLIDFGIYDTSTSTPIEYGYLCTGLKAPDVMIWVDGVKLTPYTDYILEDKEGSNFSKCIAIKMLKLPGSTAGETAPLEVPNDAMFPKPINGHKYDIVIVVAWPRGLKATSFDQNVVADEGILSRYIGPYIDNDTVSAPHDCDARANATMLGKRLFESDDDQYNTAFDYSKFKIIPVGVMPRTAMLVFQSGRYKPLGDTDNGTVLDRIFAVPNIDGARKTVQDLELHFFYDDKVDFISSTIDTLANEEEHFDSIYRRLLALDPTQEVLGEVDGLIKQHSGNDTGSSMYHGTVVDDSKCGCMAWINTDVTYQTGSLNAALTQMGLSSTRNNDIWLNANEDISLQGFGNVNVDPSDPEVTGEVNDVPSNEN